MAVCRCVGREAANHLVQFRRGWSSGFSFYFRAQRTQRTMRVGRVASARRPSDIGPRGVSGAAAAHGGPAG
eukprot:4508010-Pyramimonas_sp.AAC.1